MVTTNITNYIPRANTRVDTPQGSPHPSINPPIVADNGPAFTQKIANLLGEATHPGPIAAKSFQKSTEFPAKVMTGTDDSQCVEKNRFGVDSNKCAASETSTVKAKAVKFSKPPKIKLSEVQAGDIIFKVATEKSYWIYQWIAAAQAPQVKLFVENQDKLPVLSQDIVHCDVAIGDGKIAKVGGPHETKDWILLGYNTQSQVLPLEVLLESDTESHIVMRPKNKQVAENMAKAAKDIIDQSVSYSLPQLAMQWFAGLHEALKSWDDSVAEYRASSDYGDYSAIEAIQNSMLDTVKNTVDTVQNTLGTIQEATLETEQKAALATAKDTLKTIKESSLETVQDDTQAAQDTLGTLLAAVGTLQEATLETAEKATLGTAHTTLQLVQSFTQYYLKEGLEGFRGEQLPPFLTGDEAGPQPKKHVQEEDKPSAMFCSQYVAHVIAAGEREAIHDDRTSTTESIDRLKINPAELIDKLAGSGNYKMFAVEKDENKVSRADLVEAAEFPYN